MKAPILSARRACATAAIVMAVAAFTISVHATTSGTWTNTGSVNVGRYGTTLMLLPSGPLKGEVLMAGGFNGAQVLSSAEVYSPTTGTWSLTGSIIVPRFYASATWLPTGKVLIAGGCSGAPAAMCAATSSAEIYDPASQTFTLTGSMMTARFNHTATLLPNGTVLVAGGCTGGLNTCTDTNRAEIYKPATGTWVRAGAMRDPRDSQTATLLLDGTILVTGGESCPNGTPASNCVPLARSDVYSPTASTWMATDAMHDARLGHTATLLSAGVDKGDVLVAGGCCTVGGNALSSAELYDPATRTWMNTAPMASARAYFTATALVTGVHAKPVSVVVAGGCSGNVLVACQPGNLIGPSTSEVFVPNTGPERGAWTISGAMNNPRWFHAAVRLLSGQVLVAGGVNTTAMVVPSELYQP